VAGRLQKFNGIKADEVLYPPLQKPELFHSGELGDYFFYPSRIVAGKRQTVAIEAMRYVRSNAQLILAGVPENEHYGHEIEKLIQKYDLGHRVRLLGWISEDEKARLIANARACLYLPYDEDSYGFVTLEAFHSEKPVITFTDSGGIDELVEHGANGLILPPDPKRLAEAMDELMTNDRRALEMGRRARETLQCKNISWDHVLDRLLA
jgi:glycosyltransferase involved in cell wall biosynthesis